MAPKQGRASPSLGTAAQTRNHSAGGDHTQAADRQSKTVPARRKILRPTEIESPIETSESFRDAKQLVSSSGEDDDENIQLSEDEDEGDSSDSQYDDDEDDEDDDEDEEEEGDDDDDIESVYLSDSDDPDQPNSTAITRTSATARQPTLSPQARTATTRRDHGHKSGSQPRSTHGQTQTETTQWMVAQHRVQGTSHNMSVTRGTTTTHRETINHQFQSTNTPARQATGISRGNSLRLNMSLNVDVQFSGLVTGRNLSLAGGQLSYAWTRNRRS